MFRSTTIVRELAVKPGQSYIDMKTFNKVMSLIVMRWCGSMSQYGVCTVCTINITLARLNCKLPDDGRRPKHLGAT